MEIKAGDFVEMKKQHPCGNKIFEVTRVGLDFKIKCAKCGHEIMVPRIKILRNIKKVVDKPN